MKLVTEYYDLWREELEKYYIENTSVGSLAYSLYSVQNSVETLVGSSGVLIFPGETAEIIFEEEGIYTLIITTPILTERGGVPVPPGAITEETIYSLRHFKELKVSMLETMRTAMEGCSYFYVGCEGDNVNPTKSNLYKTQLLTSIKELYLHLLLSQDFMRDYRSCFNVTLTDDGRRLIDLIQDYYQTISLHGNQVNGSHLMRLVTAYLYLLLYVIEEDTAATTDDVLALQEGEIAEVEDMFSLEDLATVFHELNINYLSVISKMQSCYIEKPFGGDGIISDPYYGAYYGVTSSAAFPTASEIVNGTQYTADVIDSVSFSPNISVYQYAWFAIPVTQHAAFTLWEEVESAYNRSNIGLEGSGEFIVIKSTTVEVNGVEYYVYKFNWPSLFINTLRLY